MAELVQANWALVLITLVIGVAVAWWIFAANRKTRVELVPGEEGGAAARRNQALIDAAPAAVKLDTPPPAAAVAATAADDLSLIKGVGPRLQAQLLELGVSSFAQIGAWDDAEIDRIDAQLGRFAGRIRRDSWVEQARLLAAGDSAGFAAKFGNG